MDVTNRRVLLIEDNPGDARLIQEMLADVPAAEYRLEWTDTLTKGLACLSEDQFAAVLLDLSLPDSHGLLTFRAVHDHAPSIPILVLSGSSDEEIALTAVRDGAQDYLVKGKVDGYLLARSLAYAIERKQQDENQRFLSEASRVLATSLDEQATVQQVARLAVPFLADCCIVDLVDENQRPVQSGLAHRDSAQEDALRTYRRRFPVDLHVHRALAEVLQTGEAMTYRDLAETGLALMLSTGEQREMEQAFGFHAGMFVPLRARGRTLGAMCFFTTAPERRFNPADLSLATELARRAAWAIDNAQLYRQANDAIRLRDTVLTSVAHDLRNPLTAIRLIAETVKFLVTQEPIREFELIQEGLDRIEANTQRLATQIDELVDVARLQTGEAIRLVRRTTDLVAVARELIRDQQLRAHRHRIHLETTDSEVVGHWDQARVERVLGNLLSNAIKYSLEGGDIFVRVWVATGDDREWAHVAVQDHGAGIPAADLPRVFTWFYRGENVASRVAGAGIGLAGSRQIVELHGGTLRVESHEGVGSTFTVSLPRGAPLGNPTDPLDPAL